MSGSPPDSPTSSSSSNTNSSTNQTQSNVILNETLTGDGYVVTNNQTAIPDQSVNTNTTFNTTDPVNYVPQIYEDLKESVEYNYDDNVITESDNLVNEIRTYASQIKCEDFHGKGFN